MKRKLYFILFVAVALITCETQKPADAPSDKTAVAAIGPLQVRIRKMHIVRPDLLNYPIEYDVYC